MTTLGKSIAVRGELQASEDLTIDGHVEGPISCENGAVVLTATARVTGTILAREIIVLGRAAGQLIATDVVDIRAEAMVTGHVIARRFILDAGAFFSGRVAPQHLTAAVGIARYHRRQRDAEARHAEVGGCSVPAGV